MKEILVKIIHGFIIGAGGLLPGVSGGNFALAFGYYQKLLSWISDLRKNFKNNFIFFFPVALGAVLGFVIAGVLMSSLFDRWEMEMIFVFSGCLFGTLPGLFSGVKSKIQNEKKSHMVFYLFLFLIFLLLGVSVIVFNSKYLLVTGKSDFFSYLPEFLKWFLSGMIIGIGILIPGSSAAIVLIFLGVYPELMNSIKIIDLNILYKVFLGLIFSIVIFSKFLSWIFCKFDKASHVVILGIVSGSGWIFLPWLRDNKNLLICLILLLAGFIFSFVFEKWVNKNE